jgi:agmatinase
MSTLGHQYDNSLVSNAFGFLRLPMNFMPYDSDADWVITGVPFDMATSGRAGGRHGPAAIRQVSTNLAWEHNRFPWNFDMRERLNVVDCGDLVYAFGDAREMSEKLQAHAKLLAAGNACSLWRRPLCDAAAARSREALWQNGAGAFRRPYRYLRQRLRI